KLRRALDGTERVLHLVREPCRHGPESSEAIALLHARVKATVGDGDANLSAQGFEKGHLFRRERVTHAIVGKRNEPDDLAIVGLGGEENGVSKGAGGGARHGEDRCVCLFARDLLEGEGQRRWAAQSIEERARRCRFDSRWRGFTDPSHAVEPVAILVSKV